MSNYARVHIDGRGSPLYTFRPISGDDSQARIPANQSWYAVDQSNQRGDQKEKKAQERELVVLSLFTCRPNRIWLWDRENKSYQTSKVEKEEHLVIRNHKKKAKTWFQKYIYSDIFSSASLCCGVYTHSVWRLAHINLHLKVFVQDSFVLLTFVFP